MLPVAGSDSNCRLKFLPMLGLPGVTDTVPNCAVPVLCAAAVLT